MKFHIFVGARSGRTSAFTHRTEKTRWGLLFGLALMLGPGIVQAQNSDPMTPSGSFLSALQSWLGATLPWAVTALLSTIIAWGFGYLMFLFLFSALQQHAPVAARIGLWFATCALFVLSVFFVLPVYFAIHILLWHWVLASTILLLLFFVCYATAPKATKVSA